MRNDREDLTAQREKLATARSELADTLESLAVEAKRASKAARTKTGNPDLPEVYAIVRAVERAEEGVDLAALDVYTAGGGDA